MNAIAPRPSSLAIAWSAARPATLAASLAPVALGTALAAKDGGAVWSAAGAALLGAALIQVGTNLVNDAKDAEKGADGADRLGPARATASGWLSRRAVLAAAAASFALALVPGAFLVAVGGWPILVLGLVSIACGWLYTAGPAPLAYVGLGEVFVVGFFGVAATAGTYFVQRGGLTLEAVLAGLAPGLFAAGILAVNNLRDRAGDARAGKRTLAVRLGERFARAEHAACLLLPFGLALGLAIGWRGWLVALVALPLALREVALVRRADGRELNPRLGGAGRVELLFALLVGAGAVIA